MKKESAFYYILERKCFNLNEYNNLCHRGKKKKKKRTIVWIFKELVRNRQGTNSSEQQHDNEFWESL